ncbi:hypothetical protein ACHAPV_005077 [Trichoderma viride]
MINNWAVTAGRSRLQEYAGGLKTYIPSSFACLCGSFGASDVRVNRSGDGERTLEPCCGSLEVDSGVSRALVKTLNGRYVDKSRPQHRKVALQGAGTFPLPTIPNNEPFKAYQNPKPVEKVAESGPTS